MYIHWPFCEKICPYCDFNVAKWKAPDTDQWRSAYLNELAFVADKTQDHRLISIFFGGGTPSLMPPQLVEQVIRTARFHWPGEDLEITLEANPNDCAQDRLEAFARAGINRLSLGVQSLRDDALKLLGRWHSAAEAVTAFQNARAVFDNVSLDLIYARPHQTIAHWRAELEEAVALGPDHLSAYQLTIEASTAFERARDRGRLLMPDTDQAAELYLATQEICEAHGLHGYEISNHARPGKESRHNLAYWRATDYAGIGPGAHGRLTLGGTRYETLTERKPTAWLRGALNQDRHCEEAQGRRSNPSSFASGVSHSMDCFAPKGARNDGAGQGSQTLKTMAFEPLTPEQQYTEYLLMGLRTVEGVSRQKAEGFGIPLDPACLDQLAAGGLLEATADTLRLTLQGRLVLDKIVETLLP